VALICNVLSVTNLLNLVQFFSFFILISKIFYAFESGDYLWVEPTQDLETYGARVGSSN
jgi:hypothetical protein